MTEGDGHGQGTKVLRQLEERKAGCLRRAPGTCPTCRIALPAQLMGPVRFFSTKRPSCMLVTMIVPLSKKG